MRPLGGAQPDEVSSSGSNLGGCFTARNGRRWRDPDSNRGHHDFHVPQGGFDWLRLDDNDPAKGAVLAPDPTFPFRVVSDCCVCGMFAGFRSIPSPPTTPSRTFRATLRVGCPLPAKPARRSPCAGRGACQNGISSWPASGGRTGGCVREVISSIRRARSRTWSYVRMERLC